MRHGKKDTPDCPAGREGRNPGEKGIQYEGLRKLGAPHDFAVRYYEAGIDELLYLDTVASLYGRNNLSGILQRTSADVFIPVTAGGGVRSVQDVRALLRAGADKVAVNTAALKQPALITAIAQAFGRQCMVLSVQASAGPAAGWEAYFDNGREHSGRDAVAWAAEGAQRGAGEILLTSVDAEGLPPRHGHRAGRRRARRWTGRW